MEIADALSRLSPQETESISDMGVQIHEICPQFGSGILQEIRAASATDPELKELNDVVYNGCPTNIKQVPEILKPYWTFRDEITTEDGIAVKGQRIIIPHIMQNMILTKLHAGQQGLLYLDGAENLLVADYYSKYQFVLEVPTGKSSSRTIANLTKKIFSEQGIPQIVRSDNGQHFEGQAYKEFAKQYHIQHITSSPHYPRSNGFIDSLVKTIKKTMKKARATNTDPLVALLCLRATPINSTLPSPAELLFCRPIQDNLPKKIPKGKTTEDVTSRLLQRQATQKYYHDRNTKPLQPLKPGQSINIQDPRTQTWKPAEIKEKIQEVPRSYIITKPGRGEIRRNRTQIRERPQDPMEQAYQEPGERTLDNAEIPSPKSTQESQQSTTRSGRIVVPPTRLDM
ncbi:Retrovirus-related Pol poly from transposon 412 [Paramuricea clavata]|uniref:Retrovirus-related Pol poly from transposon 412 n=1 Tax=Paramuricea clavata TaxID=317549 RepID=A0A6S7IDG2_PARCT|nr:Retrovirus-related Pol poly from transposon 412 [Paramuricea clavata]